MKQAAEQQRIAGLLRTLCENELSDDAMICHDGGFRYGGDFMSMEPELRPDDSVLPDADRRLLLEAGFIEECNEEAGRPGDFRVTQRGRQFAYRDLLS